MKKRSLLAIVVSLVAGGVMAQSPVMLDNENDGAIPAPFIPVKADQAQASNKKTVVSEWYNFTDAARNAGVTYTRITNATLFPDSTVQQLYGAAGGGTQLGYVSRHNCGQIFDPKSFYYTNILTEHNPYTVDSIEFAYQYSHNIPGTVDTLEFRVYSGTAISTGTLNNAASTPVAWVGYNRTFQVGTGASQVIRVLLTESDTGWESNIQLKRIALDQPESIGRNGLIAVTYRFIPGYSYDLGDTIQQNWDPAPDKKLNHYIPYTLRDDSKTDEDSYNHGLTIIRSQLYGTSTNWDAEFIPGTAWNDYDENTYIGFRITSPNVGIKTVNSGITSKVYPNPSNGSDVLNINYSVLNSSDITISIFDLQGRLVKEVLSTSVESGNYHATANIADLENGMYVYTVSNGTTTSSGKFSVVK